MPFLLLYVPDPNTQDTFTRGCMGPWVSPLEAYKSGKKGFAAFGKKDDVVASLVHKHSDISHSSSEQNNGSHTPQCLLRRYKAAR